MTRQDDTTTVDNRDPEVIRREIHEATAKFADTLDALHDKLQPEVLVAEAKEKALDRVNTIRDRVVIGARHHPLTATLIGLGIVWLVGRTVIRRDKAKIGGGIFSFAVGAAVGVATYRAVVAERHLDDDDADAMTGEVDRDVNLTATHPSHAALE